MAGALQILEKPRSGYAPWVSFTRPNGLATPSAKLSMRHSQVFLRGGAGEIRGRGGGYDPLAARYTFHKRLPAYGALARSRFLSAGKCVYQKSREISIPNDVDNRRLARQLDSRCRTDTSDRPQAIDSAISVQSDRQEMRKPHRTGWEELL
jgi:hypothetical protein